MHRTEPRNHERVLRFRQPRNDLDGVADFAKRIGNEFVVLGWVDAKYRTDRAAWIQTAQLLSGYGAKLREHGFALLYHNHDFEFEQFDGEYGLDILLANVPEENMGVELDTHWIKKAAPIRSNSSKNTPRVCRFCISKTSAPQVNSWKSAKAF